MSNRQHCQLAVTPPACLQKAAAHDPDAPALILSARFLPLLQATADAYHRLLNTSGTGKAWLQARADWQQQADALATAVACELAAQQEPQP